MANRDIFVLRESFAEFKRLYRRLKDEERRKQFSPA